MQNDFSNEHFPAPRRGTGFYNSFVVRIWTNEQGRVRGLIEHTGTHERLAFLDPEAILPFLRAHLIAPSEFEHKRTWGHCTAQYAVTFAAAAGVRRLALFHHDPSRTDDQLDRITAAAARCGADLGVDVFAAVERSSVTLG